MNKQIEITEVSGVTIVPLEQSIAKNSELIKDNESMVDLLNRFLLTNPTEQESKLYHNKYGCLEFTYYKDIFGCVQVVVGSVSTNGTRYYGFLYYKIDNGKVTGEFLKTAVCGMISNPTQLPKRIRKVLRKLGVRA